MVKEVSEDVEGKKQEGGWLRGWVAAWGSGRGRGSERLQDGEGGFGGNGGRAWGMEGVGGRYRGNKEQGSSAGRVGG